MWCILMFVVKGVEASKNKGFGSDQTSKPIPMVLRF